MKDAFETADYFDTDDQAEGLTHEDPEEAISAFLDNQPDGYIPAAIEVTAYRRVVVADDWAARQAANLVDRLGEQWHEDYGDPEDGGDLESEELTEKFRLVIAEAIAGLAVWHCEPCAKRTYSTEEVAAIYSDKPASLLETPARSAIPSGNGESK